MVPLGNTLLRFIKTPETAPIEGVFVSAQDTNSTDRPKGPQEVVLTGSFDSWSGSLPLVKTSKGDFEITLPLKQEQQQDDKIEFKFIVDGNWTTSDHYETLNDSGNVNNVLYLKNLAQAESKSADKGSKIPEAGGLTAAASAVAATGAAALGLSSAKDDKSSKDVNTTVLPSQEGKQVSHKGEPGIAIPKNPHEISAFNEVRDVDAKQLNKDLNAKESDKEATKKTPSENLDKKEVNTTVLPSNEGNHATVAGEPGVAIPSDPHQIKEFGEVRNVDAKELNAKLNAENDENDSSALKTQVEPKEEGKHATIAGEPGIAVPSNGGKDIEEFTQVRDVDAKDLNKKLGSKDAEADGSEKHQTKIVKVKKLIRRNKKTGEETVISATPIENQANGATDKDLKTLDPKKSTSEDIKDVKDTSGGASAVTKDSKPTTTAKESTKASETTGTNVSKPKPKPASNTTTSTNNNEKKPSLFKKVKKFFD